MPPGRAGLPSAASCARRSPTTWRGPVARRRLRGLYELRRHGGARAPDVLRIRRRLRGGGLHPVPLRRSLRASRRRPEELPPPARTEEIERAAEEPHLGRRDRPPIDLAP